jgi:excisionase family DNA binding protein
MTPRPPVSQQYWSVRQCADALGYSEDAIYRAIAKGELPARKIGGRHRIDPEALKRSFASAA